MSPAGDDPRFRAPEHGGVEAPPGDGGREAPPPPLPRRRRAQDGRGPASATRRRRRVLALIILVVALVLGFALRAGLIADKYELHNDEAWSYITATGHLSAFKAAQSGGLNGRWVPAARWQSMWQPDAVLGLQAIADDLAVHGIHPPLYYWLLHFWLLVVGTHLWSGPLLNLFISAFCGLALFGLARRLLRQDVDAALVTLTWSLSRVVVATSSLARNYDLLTLWTVLFVWLLVVVNDPRRPSRRLAPVGLGVVTAAAFLTHYQFVLAVAGGVVFTAGSAWHARRTELAHGGRPWRRPLAALVAMGAGLGLTLLLNPSMVSSFRTARGIEIQPTVEFFLGKVDAVVDTVTRAFGWGTAWFDTWVAGTLPPEQAPWLRPSVVLLAAALAAGVVVVAVPQLRRTVYSRLGPPGAKGLPAVFFAAWLGGSIIAQNLAFMSQPHFMSGRYLSMAWPFWAFLPLLALRVLARRWAGLLTLGFCLLVLLPTAMLAPIRYDSRRPTPFPALASAGRVVVNATGPGQLSNTLWSVPGTALVFADMPEGLLVDSEAWITPLARGDGFAYFLPTATIPTARCVHRLRKVHRLELMKGSLPERGAYRVTSDY